MIKKRILAICGSTRQASTNADLINAITNLFSDEVDIRVFQKISDIPHFNADLDTEKPPKEVTDFRKQLNKADGILICTPEYAMGVPGTLKNAIDWTVSSMEFSHKPVALITASSSGQKAHAALLETLKIIEADISPASQLLISFAKTKIKNDTIVDTDTLASVKELMRSLIKNIK